MWQWRQESRWGCRWSGGSVGGGSLLLLVLLLVVVVGGRARAKRPRDGEDTGVHVAVVKGREETSRHVERAVRAAGAKVGNLSDLGVTVTIVW